MARWSEASLIKLGGINKNIIIDEILQGEDQNYDVVFQTDTGITVTRHSGTNITLLGNMSALAVDDKISFSSTQSLYTITAIVGQTITLDINPLGVAIGDTLLLPLDLTNCTFEFKLRCHTATITESRRSGLDVENVVPYPGSTVLDLSNNIITDVTPTFLQEGKVRFLINDTTLTDIPVMDTQTPLLYTGYIAVIFPINGTLPPQTKKQRVCFVLRTDGTTL